MSTEEGPTVVRQNLVDEAAKFLINPSVIGHSADKKKAFLRKKGLSEAEIDAAFGKVKVPGVSPIGAVVPAQISHLPVPAYAVQQPPTLWVKIRDICNFVFILTGASYGVFYLYKKYLGPLLTGRREKTVEESMIELQQSVVSVLKEVQTTLASLEQTLSAQSLRIQALNTKEDNQVVTPRQIEELRTEVTSLKGLLINRRTFPSTPSMSPAIPSWQRSKSTEKAVETPINPSVSLSNQVQVTEVDPLEGSSQSLEESNQTSRGELVSASEVVDSENGISREDSFSLASAENGGSADSLPDSTDEM